MDLGAAAVKLFPVSAIGGHGTVRALLSRFLTRIVVSGEVTLPEAPAYFAVGAWGVCIGRCHYGLRRLTFVRSRQSGTTRSRHWTRAVARP